MGDFGFTCLRACFQVSLCVSWVTMQCVDAVVVRGSAQIGR
jgi:hypothetical protein